MCVDRWFSACPRNPYHYPSADLEASSRISTQVSTILHPTPTIIPDPVTIINEIRPLARLETIQYTVEKVITAEEGQELIAGLFGDRLLLVAHGTVIAGVDLSKLTAENLEFRDGILRSKTAGSRDLQRQPG